MALYGSLLFHLNLCYSAIEVEERGDVVARCYRPLLGLLDALPWLRIAVEAPAHTLELVQALDPGWVERLAARWREGRVEFVGSGDTQLIGPLVPEAVNRWNQRLGVETYERLLGRRPEVALVGEMAWSQGLVDSYLDAGYRTLLMEWNNPHKHHREWPAEGRYRMAWTESARGRRAEVSWVDSVAFQKFQRAVHEDLDVDEYVAWVRRQAAGEDRHLFLYASDAEVFDHRPGRYEAEPALGATSEWARMRTILEALREGGVQCSLPSELRDHAVLAPRRTVCLRSAADPVPVKKQPKYNVTRWALSGRDDLGLNARCFARARALSRDDEVARAAGVLDSVMPDHAAAWRALCRDWSSDLRTHLTEARWRELQRSLEGTEPAPFAAGSDVAAEGLALLPAAVAAGPARELGALPARRAAPALVGALPTLREQAPDRFPGDPPAARTAPCAPVTPVGTPTPAVIPTVDRVGGRLDLALGGSHARLSLRRGLAIEALRFEATGPRSLLGTIPHGAYDDIAWSADFYSGHLVVDVPARRRVTDLSHVEPTIRTGPGRVHLHARIETALGAVRKHLALTPDELRVGFDLSAWRGRPLGSTRLAFVTLDPEAYGSELWLTTPCGGPAESFPLVGDFDHGESVSPLISARAAFGASEGWLRLDDGRRGVVLAWDPAVAPALPLVTHRTIAGRRFLRVVFSLGEVDETARPGAPLPPFELSIRPWTAAVAADLRHAEALR